MANAWQPEQYERHRAERERPALDLLGLVEPVPGGRVVDLGCGTGRVTALLHHHCQAAATVGVDSSAAMLDVARRDHAGDGVSFVLDDLRVADTEVDVVFSNAALHWLDDQADVIAGLCRRLPAGGQLAVQVPANFDHPSHTVADRLGQEWGLADQRSELGSFHPRTYAEILHRHGLVDIDASTRIYGNAMTRTDDVVDWVRGSLLTAYERLLGDRFDEFVVEYRRRLLDELGDPAGSSPYYFGFARTLFRGRKPT